MKVTVQEHNGCFEIGFTAECVEDAVFLSRMAVNRTKELIRCDASAFDDGTFWGSVFIGKKKNSTSTFGG